MPRLMSVALTRDQVRARTKTVTRQAGWHFLREGERLTLCEKCQGRKPGEPLVRICDVVVISVTREPLHAITRAECAREGFPRMSPAEFVAFFCASHKGTEPTTDLSAFAPEACPHDHYIGVGGWRMVSVAPLRLRPGHGDGRRQRACGTAVHGRAATRGARRSTTTRRTNPECLPAILHATRFLDPVSLSYPDRL